MGKSSSRVEGLPTGGVDRETRSDGEPVFAMTNNPSPKTGEQEGSDERRGSCRDDPLRREVYQKRKLLFREFAADTSLHGIKYTANPNHHRARRFVWLILILFASAGFILTAVDHLEKFFKFDTTVSITYLTQPNMTLPAITICNYNAFKKSAIIESGFESLIPLLLPFVTKASVPLTEVDFDAFSENLTFPDWDILELNARWGHRLEDMLLECQWKETYNCGPQDFKMTWTDLGPCFTFNGGSLGQLGEDASPYIINGTSSEEGLWIRLNLEQDDYLATPYGTAGFKVLIHSRYDVATFANPGIIQAAPGFTTYIPLTKQVIKGKKHPYVTNCADGGLKYYATYTPSTCLIECLTDAVYGKCGCILPWISVIDIDKEICKFKKTALCAFNALVGVNCPCNMPCLEEHYMTRVSMTTTPAQYAIPMLSDKYNMTADEIKNNIVDLYVYFEDRRVTVIEHKEAFDFYDLTSAIGGQLGLLLGASALTLFEFLDYLAVYHAMGVTLLQNLCRKNRSKQR